MHVAGRSTVYTLFAGQARWQPQAVALECAGRQWRYGELLAAVDGVAGGLRARGIGAGERIGILAENRVEYTVLQLAAARIGAIVACLNWRQSAEELEHCIRLVEPRLIFVSERFTELLAATRHGTGEPLPLASCLGELAAHAPDSAAPHDDPEQGLLLLYTSGTTGLPKAALISQRAEIARMTVLRMDLNIMPGDAYIAWSPMFHMGGTEHTLASLMFGSTAIITDGFDLETILDAIQRYPIGWLLLMPATLEPVLQAVRERGIRVKGAKAVGCMPDLFPQAVIEEAVRVFGAPFLNSFGATETGLPPLTGHLMHAGEPLDELSKRRSSLCELRIADEEGNDVADGETGEALVRGPTLFSGYWNAPEINAREFRDGWFHMGDLFRRAAGGGFDFVGRSKYLIKSGGENIYPAEVERVLLADPRVDDAALVRKPDPKWGELAVAFIARNDASLDEAEVERLCRARLAAYKRPREVHFIALEEMPRSLSGKIKRDVLEQRLAQSD